MVLEARQILSVLSALENASIFEFLSSLLNSPGFANHPTVLRFESDISSIIKLLYESPGTSSSIVDTCHKLMSKRYADEIICLISMENSWHFSAHHTMAEQLQAFSLEDMALWLMAQAPLLWDLLGIILQANPLHERCHTTDIALTPEAPDDGNEEYWAQFDNSDSEDIGPQNTQEGASAETQNHPKKHRRATQHRIALLQIVHTSISTCL